MAEYIERQKLESDFKLCNKQNPRWTPQRVASLIARGPAADVAPVVHGEWVVLDECSNEGVYCSVCNKKVYKVCYGNCKMKSKFCPNCGARMDGGHEDG